MDFPSQLTTHVQVRNLVFTTGKSQAIDMSGFSNCLFAVNFPAVALASATLQSSPDGTTWTTVAPSYFTDQTNQYPKPGNGTAETVAFTTTAANQFLFLSLNRPQPTMRYLRLQINSGTVGYGVALLGGPVLSAPTQPDLACAEFKGTF